MGENLDDPDFRISFVVSDVGVDGDEVGAHGVVAGVGSRGSFL